jgi:hypothetical protein
MHDIQIYMYDKGLGELPKDFEPTWTTKRGTLPKRITAHCYKVNKVKLSPEQVSELGNIARRHTSLAETYILDFTRLFDWNAGDFGDSGSCFWGSNSGARLMLVEHGAYAIRAYKWKNLAPNPAKAGLLEYENVRGFARAWVVKLPDNKLVVYNGYGSGITTLDFARILALKYSLSYKKINVTNNGSQSGLMYINSGSYIVGAWNKIEAIISHDLCMEDIEDSPQYLCSQCGDEIQSEDDICYALNRYGESVACCCDCSSYCERCEESYVDRQVSELDGEYYCRDCRTAVIEERAEQERIEAEQAEQDKIASESLATHNSNMDVVASILESEDN